MVHNERRESTRDGKNRTANTKFSEKNLHIFENIRSGIHKTSGDEKKKIKKRSQKNEEIIGKQTIQQLSHQRDKRLDTHSFKILVTILEVDDGRNLNK